MIVRKAVITMLLIGLCIVASGCWSRRELNQLSITVGLGIDKAGDEFMVTAQVVDPGQVATKASGSATRVPVTVYRQTAPSIQEALREMTTESPRRIYMSHLRMLVIGEELARSGISEALDFLSRGHETRTDFYVAIAKKSRAADILEVLTPLEKIPASKLFSSLEVSSKFWAPTHGVHLDELLNNIADEGRSPTLTGIVLSGSASKGDYVNNTEHVKAPAELRYVGLAVFRKDKLIGWLSEEESRAYNFIQGSINQATGNLECEDGGKIVIDIVRARTRIKGDLVNGKPQFRIRLEAESDIAESSCKKDIVDPAEIKRLNQQINDMLERMIHQIVRKAQRDYKYDFLGFGNVFRRAHPQEWKKLKDDWDEKFVTATVDVEADCRIRRIGTITNPLNQQMEE